MSDNLKTEASPKPKAKRINLRTPEVMARVQEQIENHYRSKYVERIRDQGGVMRAGNTVIRLARQFGFCYGVERAIDLAYAARRTFPERRLFLLGEIIHNPDVNAQLKDMGIEILPRKGELPDFDMLTEEDVAIVPAFGAQTHIMDRLKAVGCYIVDTTCGDVMSVWRRVKQNAKEGVTSIIHGKANHEETLATASRALGNDGNGHYLVVLNLRETDYVCNYIRNGGNRKAFCSYFQKAMSEGFDPDVHLKRVGVANQTTMLRSETEEIQRRVGQAILDRDGNSENYRFFDTICGATQERQSALFEMLELPVDLVVVIGGYNSSNTTHLVEISEEKAPTYFIRNVQCIEGAERVCHFDIHEKVEKETKNWLPQKGPLVVSVTAGASCPNNLIEEVIEKIIALRMSA